MKKRVLSGTVCNYNLYGIHFSNVLVNIYVYTPQKKIWLTLMRSSLITYFLHWNMNTCTTTWFQHFQDIITHIFQEGHTWWNVISLKILLCGNTVLYIYVYCIYKQSLVYGGGGVPFPAASHNLKNVVNLNTK